MAARDRMRLGMALGALFALLWLAWLARAGLVPFLLGILLAYLLTPPVRFLSKRISGRDPEAPWVRITAILVIYLALGGVLTGLGFLIVPPIVDNVQELIDRQDEIIQAVQDQVNEWLEFYRSRVPVSMQERIDTALQNAGSSIGGWLTSIATSGASMVFASISAAIGYLVIPVWLFLVLKDQRQLFGWFYGLFPVHIRGDVRHIVRETNRVLGSYIRSLIVLALIVGIITYVGLRLLGVPYALALAITAGFLELIPIIGPIVATVIAVGVVLAIDPGLTVLWVFLLFLGVQQFENNILVPKIQGDALEVHPALVILLVLGVGEIFGLIGMALAPPLYAVVRNAYVYIFRRLGGMPRPLEIAVETGEGEQNSPVRCPEDT